MQNRLREALLHLWTSLWGRRAPIAVKTEAEDKSRGRRARFWTEFRDGQREAEANSRPR